eukprot:9662870-Ditylum_brightwellii.AAC.1
MFVHAQTLQKVKYRLKTALGVSEEYYQHCITFPIYGIGQGATDSVGIWLIISLTIVDIYEQSANGAKFISSNQAVVLTMSPTKSTCLPTTK